MDDRTEPVDHPIFDGYGAGRSSVKDRAQARHVVSMSHFIRQFEHPHEVRGYELSMSYAVPLNQRKGLLGVELVHHDDRAAMFLHHHRETQGSRMVEGGGRQEDSVLTDAVKVPNEVREGG